MGNHHLVGTDTIEEVDSRPLGTLVGDSGTPRSRNPYQFLGESTIHTCINVLQARDPDF